MQQYVPDEEDTIRMDVYPDAIVLTREKLQPDMPGGNGIALVFCLVYLLLPVAVGVGEWYLATHPFTATVLVRAQQVSSLAHVYTLPVVTDTQSQVVLASGHKHIAATQAHGAITFYNGLTQPQTIDAGTLLVGSDGQEVVTDETATIPAGTLSTNGAASVGAHALDFGLAGNIQAGDIYGPCCRAFIQVVNSQFTGGHAAREYQLVTKADIDTATNNLLAQVGSGRNFNVSPGLTLLTPVSCSTTTASNHKVGDTAVQVMVTVRQTCSPTAYRPQDVLQRLMGMVTGRTKQDALRHLLAMPGIRSASISWVDDMNLPKDTRYIHLAILIGQ
jgi:hypothetical protein